MSEVMFMAGVATGVMAALVAILVYCLIAN